MKSVPETVSLVRIDSPLWLREEEASPLAASLKKLGFSFCGFYRIKKMPGMTISGFCHTGKSVMAAITEHETRGVWLDMTVEFSNNETLTYSNSCGRTGPEIPGHTVITVRNARAGELLEQIMRVASRNEIKKVSPSDFASGYERLYRAAAARINSARVSTEAIMDNEGVLITRITESEIKSLPATAKGAMTKEKAFAFLKAHHTMPDFDDTTENYITRFEEVVDYFIANHEPACLKPIIFSMRPGTDEFLEELVYELIREYPRGQVNEAVQAALEHSVGGVRQKAAEIASHYPSATLAASIKNIVDCTKPSSDEFLASINALKAIASRCRSEEAEKLIVAASKKAFARAKELYEAGDFEKTLKVLEPFKGFHNRETAKIFREVSNK